MKKTVLILFLTILIISALNFNITTADAQEPTWKTLFKDENINIHLSLPVARIQGHTTYFIDFKGGASKLEFPLNNTISGVKLDFIPKGNTGPPRGKLSFTWLTQLNEKAGDMKDSDWITSDVSFFNSLGWSGGRPHEGLDIYSESTAKLNLKMKDLSYAYNFLNKEKTKVGAIVGYCSRKFEYEITNLTQVGYGPYAPYFTVSAAENVIDYEVNYNFLYWGLTADLWFSDNFQLGLETGYSSRARAHDVDDHILRNKLSKANTKGSASRANLKVFWQPFSHWFAELDGTYEKIDTEGQQHQFYYSGSLKSGSVAVDDEITAEFSIISLNIGYRF
ncbi:MAG: omptin family outer membrane protease [Planctomycetes bacterium]|nr:omptin family outer membrane protease [Planctomycetota bacterium]